MSQIYRPSRFIDFNEGRVILDPESFVEKFKEPWGLEQKIDFFACRVEVWQLGVAVEMLKQIEANELPSTWSQAAYGLLSVIASYFEMVGKVLNPGSKRSRTSGVDFNWGFCSVYPDLRFTQSAQPGPAEKYNDAAVPKVARLRDLMRNGMYHLGFPKKNMLIHNSPDIPLDFEIVNVLGERDGRPAFGTAYFVNPHRVTRTLVDHFADFIAMLGRTQNVELREKFEVFFDEFDET